MPVFPYLPDLSFKHYFPLDIKGFPCDTTFLKHPNI